MGNGDYEIRVEETRGTRAVAKTGVWQNWERDFPKKFGTPESTDKTVLGRRTDGPRCVGGEDNRRRQGLLMIVERRKEQRKQRVKL